MLYCKRKIWLPILLGLLVATAGEAEISFWKLGSSDHPWNVSDTVSVMIDSRSTPGSIQPVYITPDRTVLSYLSNWSPLWTPRELGYVDGERPRVAGGLRLIDGDSTTYNPPTSGNQDGQTFRFDLAVPIPIFHFGFYTPSIGYRADGALLRHDFIPAYQLFIAAEDENSWKMIADINENFAADVSHKFPRQYVRFARYVRRLSAQEERRDKADSWTVGQAVRGTIGDFEIYGQGIPKRAFYITKITDLQQEMNLGRLFWKTTSMRMVNGVAVEAADADASIQIEVRTGWDGDPVTYHEYTNKGKEVVVSRQRYEYELKTASGYVTSNRPGVRASERYDTENWTYWSVPITQSGLPLRLEGGSYLQLKITLNSEEFDDFVRLDSLWIEQTPLLARQVVGEVARLDDPRPAQGFTETEMGAMTDFSYDIRSLFVSSAQPGFDAIRLRTGNPVVFRSLEIGDPLVAVSPEQIIDDGEGMIIHLPQRITRRENMPIRVVLGTEIFVLASTLEGEVFDKTTAGLPQPIIGGDATAEVSTNSLRILARTGTLPPHIQSLDLSTPVLTPNNDGSHDELKIQYSLFRLPDRIPVELSIYRLDGRRVAHFLAGEQGSGAQQILWDGRDNSGMLLAPGLYLVEIALRTAGADLRQTRSVSIAY